MSIFGSLMGDLEEDPFFGSHMNMMRQMNTMMNSMFSDPFAAIGFGDFEQRNSNHHQHHHHHHHQHHHHRIHNALMPFTMPMIPNFNRLLSGSLDSLGGGGVNGNAHSYSSSTVVSMSSGPDGRPEVYKATSSTRTAPGGIKETQRTVTDSRTGTKKMAIGHHIGERAHIIEKEQNIHTGDQEERQDFINLEEEEAEDFNREWETKTRSRSEIPRITATSASARNRHTYGGSNPSLLAITGGPSSTNRGRIRQATTMTSPLPPTLTSRRSIRASPLTMSSSSSASSRTPYSTTVPGHHRKQKNIKTVSGPSSSSSSSSPTPSSSQQEK